MRKKCFRFFGGLLKTQENWLNRMSENGWRLTSVRKLTYEFEPCDPGEYEYRVEFVAHQSYDSSRDYRDFLEELGYRVFYKNINLNYSLGKVRYRPWAQKGGRIATSETTYNRELMIVEKRRDGKPFELHTSYSDLARYYREIRGPWLFLFLLFALGAVWKGSFLLALCSLMGLIPTLFYQRQIIRLNRKAKIHE